MHNQVLFGFSLVLEQQLRLQSPVSSGVVCVTYPSVGLYRQELRQTNKPTNKQTHKNFKEGKTCVNMSIRKYKRTLQQKEIEGAEPLKLSKDEVI